MVKSAIWRKAKEFGVVCVLGSGLALMASAAQGSPRQTDGTSITVNFDFDASDLNAQARHVLDERAEWMLGQRDVIFYVYGFADRVGPSAYNRELGLRRALAVASELVRRGVDPEQLRALVSYGEDHPVVETEQAAAANRRVLVTLAAPAEGADFQFSLAKLFGGDDARGRKRPGAGGSDQEAEPSPSADTPSQGDETPSPVGPGESNEDPGEGDGESGGEHGTQHDNNGFGNGDQDAPGNSGDNNNAENASDDEQGSGPDAQNGEAKGAEHSDQGSQSNNGQGNGGTKKTPGKGPQSNNGFGNGDQDAPGGSLEHNNAENSQR
jgi:hypothetical protein